jgi:hypothetical protein
MRRTGPGNKPRFHAACAPRRGESSAFAVRPRPTNCLADPELIGQLAISIALPGNPVLLPQDQNTTMRYQSTLAAALLIAPAMAQFAPLPAPTLLSRTAPRATWTSVISAGTNTTGTTFRCDNPAAASNGVAYVFGGCLNNNTSTTLNDLWAFDAVAGTFTQVHNGTVSLAPHARGRAAIAWNASSNKLVVFGGDNRATGPLPADTLLADTWEYDPTTSTWADVTPASGNPSPRRWASMAYDPALGGMVMFGGDLGANAVSSETWSFVGGVWSQLTPAHVPPARRMASLMTRSDFNDAILCAGEDPSLTGPYGTDIYRHLDVWTWNGTDWTLLSDWNWASATGSFPASATANQATYDALRKRIVMQGGQGIAAGAAANATYLYPATLYGGSPSNYTSEFDCVTNTWSIYASPTTGTSPFNNNDTQIGRISRFYAAFVPATGKVYKLCGQNAAGSGSKPTYSVYAYQANPVAAAPAVGTGCTGSAGPLALSADNLPWTTRTFSATGTGFPAGSLGFAAIGWVPSTTPLSTLHPAGGAGCDLLVTPDVTLLLLPNTGAVHFSIGMPADPIFAGAVLTTQALCIELDPSFNITAVTSTNALAVTIGAL